jgi:hypothetical protein
MPEADAEGASPLDLDNHIAKEMTETILWYDVFAFLSAPNFAKRKRMEQAEDSSPDPSSSACEIRR